MLLVLVAGAGDDDADDDNGFSEIHKSVNLSTQYASETPLSGGVSAEIPVYCHICWLTNIFLISGIGNHTHMLHVWNIYQHLP